MNDESKNIFIKYISIINDFLLHCNENVSNENKTILKYTIRRGIESITHIFKIVYISTKDLDFTFDICKQSFVYYIEFITQICDDDRKYLNLNSRDAVLFIYKKSINKYKILDSKITDETNNILKLLDKMINIHNEMLNIYIESDEYNKINYDKFEKNIYLFVEKIINVKNDDIIEIVYEILLLNKIHKINIFKHLNIINLFLDKKYKKGLSPVIKKKLNSSQNKNYLLNEVEDIYVNWLFNNK